MELSSNYVIFFIIGFLIGVGIMSIFAWYISVKKLDQVQNPRDELIALRSEMSSINTTIDNFKNFQEFNELLDTVHKLDKAKKPNNSR